MNFLQIPLVAQYIIGVRFVTTWLGMLLSGHMIAVVYLVATFEISPWPWCLLHSRGHLGAGKSWTLCLVIAQESKTDFQNVGATEHFMNCFKKVLKRFFKKCFFYMNTHACCLSTCEISFNNTLYYVLHKKDKISAQNQQKNKPLIFMYFVFFVSFTCKHVY